MERPGLTVDRVTPSGMWPVWAVVFLSLGSGFVVFVGVGLVAWAMALTVRVALASAGVAVLAVWLVWLARVDGLFFTTERVRPVAPVALEQTAPVVRVEVNERDRGRWQFVDLPGGPDELQALARGLLLGRPFSEGEWSGRGRLYSRAQFRALRGELLERGLVCWRNPDAPGQGVELSAVGRAVMARIAEPVRTSANARPARTLSLPNGKE